MLRLPTEKDEPPPLVIASRTFEEDEGTLSSETYTEPDEFGRVKKRRRSKKSEEEVFDETFAGKEEVSPKMVRALMGTVAALGVFLVVALLWPSGNDETIDALVGSETIHASGPERDELEIEAEKSTVSPKLVEDELLPVYKSFLTAKTPEEMSRWVFNAERTLPRMKKYYGEEFFPEGFSAIVFSERSFREQGGVGTTIRTGDYSKRRIFTVENDGWKVDWESWVGWSEMSWKEFKEERPLKPVMFRVMVSDVTYYNFGFTDDVEWSSYRFEPLDGEQVLFGYVERSGDLDAQLKSRDRKGERPFILKLRYPEGAPSDNQVLVEEVVADGWFLPEDQS